MVSCTDFTSNFECALTYSNEFHIKFIVLTLLLIFSVIGLYLINRMDKDKTYMHFWFYWIVRVTSYLYLVFSVLFYLLLLSPSINLEIFTTIIISFYLLTTGVFIGMSIYYGSSEIWRLFGFDDWNEFKDRYRERKSMRKYG